MLGRSLSISTKIIFEWLLPYFDIIASMNSKKVSFISNHDTRCVPCTFGMGLAYFSPKLKFTMKELENFCGFKEGHGTWKAEAMLGMARLGYEVYWIEQFDFNSFSNNPEAYLRSILSDEVYKEQASNTDLQLEAKRMKKYINSGLPLEYRQGTNDDIKDFLDVWDAIEDTPEEAARMRALSKSKMEAEALASQSDDSGNPTTRSR